MAVREAMAGVETMTVAVAEAPAAAVAAGVAAVAAGAPATRVFAVGEWSDVAITRHQARRLAREHGIAPRRAGEGAIVVSELASNIVQYGGGRRDGVPG